MMFFTLMISGFISVLAIVSGFLMFWRIPSLPGQRREDKRFPFVTIIIPARNEAERITPLLASLKKQSFQAFETIVVDDGSVDGTAGVARTYGARVFSNQETENGWSGKSLACWNGALQANGEWLLFLDADTQFVNEDSLERYLSSYQHQGGTGILSLQPYHTVKHLYENVSSIFNIIVMVGMNVFTIWKERLPTAGSFGPSILCDRKEYFSVGGHERIQEAIMDDLALGEQFTNQGLPVRCFGGSGILSFRMYPEGFRQLIEGWTKNFATASKSTHPVVMTLINIWIAGGMISAAAFIGSILISADSGLIILTSILYALYALQLGWLARRTGNFRLWIFIFYPILLIFFTIIFLYSLYRTNVLHSVTWRGRNIHV